MFFLSRFSFRENWPLSVAIVAIVAAIAVYIAAPNAFSAPVFYLGTQNSVNYPELISEYSERTPLINLLLGLFGYLILIVIIGFLFRQNVLRFVAIVLTLLAGGCGCFMMVWSGAYADWTTLENMQTVTFNGHTYHLTYANESAGGADVHYAHYYVFECDLEGIHCTVIGDSTKYYDFDNPFTLLKGK